MGFDRRQISGHGLPADAGRAGPGNIVPPILPSAHSPNRPEAVPLSHSIVRSPAFGGSTSPSWLSSVFAVPGCPPGRPPYRHSTSQPAPYIPLGTRAPGIVAPGTVSTVPLCSLLH